MAYTAPKTWEDGQIPAMGSTEWNTNIRENIQDIWKRITDIGVLRFEKDGSGSITTTGGRLMITVIGTNVRLNIGTMSTTGYQGVTFVSVPAGTYAIDAIVPAGSYCDVREVLT